MDGATHSDFQGRKLAVRLYSTDGRYFVALCVFLTPLRGTFSPIDYQPRVCNFRDSLITNVVFPVWLAIAGYKHDSAS
jgi:hypothetical protein